MTDFSTSINEAASNTDMNVSKEQQLTQVELERQMAAFGKARAEKMMQRNEDAGSADNNPYAKALYNRYVLPLADMIRTDIKTKRPGRSQAHVSLLEPMDAEAVAFLAVRATINSSLTNEKGKARHTMEHVGRSVYQELMLSMFSEASPELFYTLTTDLSRRMSKSERHKVTLFKMQAKANGIPVPEWGGNGIQQVGAYLIESLTKLGMVEINKYIESSTTGIRKLGRFTMTIELSDTCLEVISRIKSIVMETTPYSLPCIEQPKDWVSIMDGGYHTTEMRRMAPFCIKSKGGWSQVAEHDLSNVFSVLNSLQRTPWQVNSRMLDAIKSVAKHFDMEEIISQAEFPAPTKPEWLIGDMKVEQMTPDEELEFKEWKSQMREWYTNRKLRGTKFGRFHTAITVADKFSSFPQIYFVYSADFRGRLYAQSTGVSPQGSDMQKALLRFAVGKPLASKSAEDWFCINGANRWGFDKASLEDRVKWVADHHEQIMAFAADPIANSDWRYSDSPLQFLAWAFEYAEWRTNPEDFISHIPVGMDGSCNGLQNFSAMLRDEIGGKATNLIPSDLPNDIYQMVADVTAQKLKAAKDWIVPMADENDADTIKAARRAELANKHKVMWIKHGISRSLVKRSVMTLPYGSTRFSCADFIVGDYLKEGKATEFSKMEYMPAAGYLSHLVWDSIGEVVVKAREAMDYLQVNTKKMIGDKDHIFWMTPSGFPVYQFYNKQELHRINTKLCGNTKIRMNVENDEADPKKHRNGIAPNFIHSHDASHLHLVVLAAKAYGLHLAMIHDDYGTHAADAAILYDLIRQEFVAMYEAHDPFADLVALYDLPSPPKRGNLDLSLVLRSPYFFS